MNPIRREAVPVRNPRTGTVDHFITPPSAEELSSIATSLRAAQLEWAAAPIEHRIAILLRWAEEIEANKAAIARAESIDTGRGRLARESPEALILSLRGWAEQAPEIVRKGLLEGTSTIMPHIRFCTQLKPYALVGVISPWNFPMMLSVIDAIPALLAGCAVIIKPSEVTPRFVTPLMETIGNIPELARVLTYVVGNGETGQQLIHNVDILCFTGSVATGRKVAETCARRFIPVFLELGGKDPVIITENADLELATDAVLRGAVYATGQICYSIERVYVQEKIHDAFVERLARKAEEIDLNYPDINKGHIGPFISRHQAAIVDAQLDDALRQGATIRTGGKSQNLGGGLYMRPTIVTNVRQDMKIMQEETFGPVIPVMKYKTKNEAVQLANDTVFGLSAAVIAGSDDEALELGLQIDAGGISLQDTTLTTAILRDAEKNSFNLSGMGGSRMGPAAIMRFYRKKALMMNTLKPQDMREIREVPAA
ncbi:MAG: aldehyde dehydrogenase family protein [Synechococcaceae cyanobacterium]|nr:aldehyde dehydrogenase family protein [Synechococcaceae cyanobacterium]